MKSISPNITEIIDIDTTTPIITPEEVGAWLNLSPGMVTLRSAMITRLINTAVVVIENYTWLALRKHTYEAYFDLPYNDFLSFYDGSLKLSLERSPVTELSDITKIEYLDSGGTYKLFDRGALTSEGLYENTTEAKEQRNWASILFRKTVPFDGDRKNAYKVKVTFKAGFDRTNPVKDIPPTLLTGILMIVAFYYTNRGDCSGCGCDLNGYPVPCEAKGLIDQYSVAKTVLGGSYIPAGFC